MAKTNFRFDRVNPILLKVIKTSGVRDIESKLTSANNIAVYRGILRTCNLAESLMNVPNLHFQVKISRCSRSILEARTAN